MVDAVFLQTKSSRFLALLGKLMVGVWGHVVERERKAILVIELMNYFWILGRNYNGNAKR